MTPVTQICIITGNENEPQQEWECDLQVMQIVGRNGDLVMHIPVKIYTVYVYS